jgi:DNA end-binding protein Ku
MLMETLVFADEVVPPESLDEVAAGAEIEVTERELTVARQLIEMLAAPFDPAQYHDDYREAVLALIERKMTGQEVAVAPAAAPAPATAPDLMAALQASVEAVGRYSERWDGGEEDAPKPKRTRKQGTAAAAPARKRATSRQPTKKS